MFWNRAGMAASSVKNFSAAILAASFLVPFCGAGAGAEDIPKSMSRIVIRALKPKPDPNSFNAQPRVIYRSGLKYARIEEAPDPVENIHGLVVVNEPDAYMINLFTNNAKHMVDPGPTMHMHMPVFGDPENPKSEVGQLEFGSELEFFQTRKAAKSAGPVIAGHKTTAYTLELEGKKLRLLVADKDGKPVRISMIEPGEGETELAYDEYEAALPFDESKFKVPTGLAIQEPEPHYVSPLSGRR